MFMRPSWRSWFKFFSAQEEKNGNKYHVIQAKAQPKQMIDEENAALALELWHSTGQSTVSSSDMDKDHGAEEFDGDKVNY